METATLQKADTKSVQRNYKDTMFRLLFKEKKNLLSLYNAINETHYEDDGQVKIVTLDVERVRTYSKAMPLEEAVRRTVDECIEEGILWEFLMRHKREAIEVCIFEYNEERALQYIKEDEYELGRAEGQKFGRNIILNMLKKGLPEEQICAYTECDPSVIEDIRKKMMEV